eukprot:TRINITY_DN49318_c0_g1_i1.p1 TRINITY_DN49318_c0_g1~~TRINITY_DN49318_c0_g1_i1.p1  ORF type:complete len:333 (+),score=56.37 TRINITY_DN49318_c0_g1_i1:137-1135(+)
MTVQPLGPDFAKPKRFTEPLKLLPVVFMCCTISFLYLVYVLGHCVPRLQLDVGREHVDNMIRIRGGYELYFVTAFTVMLVICYIRAMATSPGEVPDDDPHWQYQEADKAYSFVPNFLKETKKSGDRRHCKWCGKYKPDRTHHCRVCKTCCLKMDHHCPWIYNCVGFYNYKYFFLMLFYSMLDLQLITWTMAESVQKTIDYPTPFGTMFLVLFGETVAAFLGILVTLFFFFHCWLISQSMTTIEFCEKQLPKKDVDPTSVPDASKYDRGLYANICGALGDVPIFWFFPIWGPSGDGLKYLHPEETPLIGDDLDETKKMQRKSHKFGMCDEEDH